MRPSWDEYFMLIAKLVSTRSTCNSRPTGAVLVKDKQILATGYNGSMPGAPHCIDQTMPDGSRYCHRRALKVPEREKYNYCRASHAEANAIAQAALHGVCVKGATLYVTLEPCYICLKLLAAAQIEKIYFELQYGAFIAKSGPFKAKRSRDIFWKTESLNEAGFKDKYLPLEVSQETISFILPSLIGITSERRLTTKKASALNLSDKPLVEYLKNAEGDYGDYSLGKLWTVEFMSNLQIFGSGVAVFEDGRIFGGDSQYYYLGNFQAKYDNFITAEVKVIHFAGQPYSIFGLRKEFILSLSGKLNIPVMELSGYVVGDPNLTMVLRLTWRAHLPATADVPKPVEPQTVLDAIKEAHKTPIPIEDFLKGDT
jgi:dCMP deaminase